MDYLGEGVAVARRRPRPRQMHEQVVVRRELGGARVLRKEVALLEVEFAQVRHALRFRHDLRVVREQHAHLPLGLDVALLAEEAEAVGIVQVLARPDGEQHVVGFGVLFP